jgi:type I restriction enzyme S subunit
MDKSNFQKLGDVCNFIGGSQPAKSNFVYDLTGLDKSEYARLIQIRDYKSDKHIVYILKSSTKKFCTKNDVMIGRYGPPVFQILRGLEGAYNVALMKAIPKLETLNNDYLFYFLMSPGIQSYIIKLSERAAGQTGVNKPALHDFPILVPSIKEQKRIVALLDTVFADLEQTRAKTEQNLKNARELFDSYLQQVFSQKGEDWVEKTLGETVVVERGSSPRPIKNFQTTDEDGVNWIKIGDTKGITKYIASTKEKITPAGAEKSRKVNEGDFILSNSMSFGKPYIMATSGYIHDGWFVFRLPESVDTEFFYYLLSSPFVQKQFQTLSSGAIVKNISGDLVKKAHLPIPPLTVQKSIADELVEISKETEKLEAIYQQKLNSIDELKKSILQKAFNGELTKQPAAT